jgi:hypothetical protein
MKLKTSRKKYTTIYLFIFAVSVAVVLNIVETYKNNNLPYADNDVLANERIKLLLIYGAGALPLFTIGLVLAIRSKAKQWAVINALVIGLIIIYVLFIIGLISALRYL